MGSSWLLILGLIVNVSLCLEILGSGEENILDITHNITGVLGEDVYLTCTYLGDSEIISAQWKRQVDSKVKSRRLAGFMGHKLFSHDDDISAPDSSTNLTVKMRVSRVEAEGEYTCEFSSLEETISDNVMLTVVARPDVHTLVNSETVDGTHYQSVTCSAVSGRPTPHISWLLNSVSPSVYNFTVEMSETLHTNGTSTLSSTLLLPTRLLEEDSVTCVVQHPTLPNPRLTTVRVETYVRPNVTIKSEMVQRGGTEFWVVSCVSAGGRPDTDISLALNTDENLQRETDADSDTQTSSFHLPVTVFEGRNVTCVFDHPSFTHKVSRVITLPSFYLSVDISSLGSRSSSDPFQEALDLQEGQTDAVIQLEVTGNVPHYKVTCKKDHRPLPAGLELVGSSLTVQAAVTHQHAGLYECEASYHHHRSTLQFNVTVKPQVSQPVPPTIGVHLQSDGGHSLIECSAAEAFPAANISWLLPEGVSGVTWLNFTSHNGSHSVRGVLLLPACPPQELTAECLINHPAYEQPENRRITLPLCTRPNITFISSIEWKDGKAFTKVDCAVDSVAPAATITWAVGRNKSISHLADVNVLADGSTCSSVRLLVSLYSGHDLTCTVEHPSLQAPEKRSVHIPVLNAPVFSVSMVTDRDSPLWLAVCDLRTQGVATNLTWVLPKNAEGRTSLHSVYEGLTLKARLTYEFTLASHEGQRLTCVHHFGDGHTEQRTVYIPRYYISSVRVLNNTSPLRSRYGDGPVIHRVTLQENHLNQRILLQVEGNMPGYNLSCYRRGDSVFVQVEGAAIIFQSEVTEQDEGLYTCQVSFYHHSVTVNIQVEVMSKDKLFALVMMVCISLALALTLILSVTLWVLCKRNSRPRCKMTVQEPGSLSALTTLMSGSPEVPSSPVIPEKDSKELAQLINYSIVIDIKSAV